MWSPEIEDIRECNFYVVAAPITCVDKNHNTDFYVGSSPDRLNLGDTVHTVENIMKVTSSFTNGVG